VKAGARVLGIAESYANDADRSTLAGVVYRIDRTVDGFVFGSCSVGGTDATAAIVDCWGRLDRPDVQYVVVAGIALAWYNLVDLRSVHEATDRPVAAVAFEASEGLEAGLRDAFDGDELVDRLAAYRRQPPRDRCQVNGEAAFVRSAGFDGPETAHDLVRETTPSGARPDPLRIANGAARAADAWRRGAPAE
jgi:endonuclease V-like protein UPF0215 family